MIHVKICGIKDPNNLSAAINAGARYIGLVFYPPSPRHVSVDSAGALSLKIPTGVKAVGLFVDPTDEQIEQALSGVQLDMIQLHGAESPARVQQIKDTYALPIMKAFRIAAPADLREVSAYEPLVDYLLFDTRVEGEALPGGTGHSFDWTILKGRTFTKPWMLSGGLNTDNVASALGILQPNAVDVSSGVERSRGEKDPEKIRQFIEAVKQT